MLCMVVVLLCCVFSRKWHLGVSVSDNFECVRIVIVVFFGISEMGFTLLLWTSSMEVGRVGVLVIWVVVILTQNWYICMRLCCMVASVAVGFWDFATVVKFCMSMLIRDLVPASWYLITFIHVL